MNVYKDLDMDAFERANEIAQARRTGGGDYWKPKPGTAERPNKHVLRVMPPHVNMPEIFVEAAIHFGLGPQRDVAVNCLRPFGEACPACLHVDELRQLAQNEDDPASAEQLLKQVKDQGAKVRLFANIVDMDEPEKGVQRYAFGPDVEKKLRMCFFDDDGTRRNITHPRTGRDILMYVGKKPRTDFNEYSCRAKETSSALQDMDWLNQIHDLSDFARKPSREEVENALRGIRAVRTASGSTAAAASSSAKPRPKTASPAAAPPAAAKTIPPAAAKTAPATASSPKKRMPVAEAEPEGSDPYAIARARCHELGFDAPIEIEPKDVEKIKKPPCYKVETDPTDEMCQSCKVLLPCLTEKMIIEAA